MESQQSQTFDFNLDLDLASPSLEGDNSVTFLGSVAHSSESPVNFALEGDAALRLGYRVLSSDASTVLFEDRAAFDVPTLAPKCKYPLKIIVPQALLQSPGALVMVDFLYENQFWFHEQLNRPPSLFVLDGKSSLPSPANVPPIPGEDRSGAGKVRAALEKHDFSGYAAVKSHGSENSGIRLEVDARTLRALNACEDLTDVMPLTEFMRYYALVRRQKSKGPTSRAARFELLREMFPFLSSIQADTEMFIPRQSIDYLNETPLADGLFDVPMTRLMLWCWLSEGKNLRPYMRLDREDVYWWWVTGAMPAKKVPPALMGGEVLAYLGGAHEDFRGRVVALSRFFHKAYRESRALQERYNLQSDEGLIAYSFDTLIHNFANPVNRRLFSPATLEFWRQPIGDDRQDPSLFELALASALDGSKKTLQEVPSNECRKVVRQMIVEKNRTPRSFWMDLYSQTTREVLDRRASRASGFRNPSGESVSIVGLTTSQSGLGVNARMSRAVFEHLGYKVNMIDTRGVPDRPVQHRGTALYHINADALPAAMLEGGAKAVSTERRVGFFLWELNTLPESHRLGVDLVDEIWVPSEFLRNVYAQATKKPVVNVGKYLLTPDLSRLPQPKEGVFTFLVSFDFHSGVERKNPLAALKAFASAFPPHVRDVAMVVKTTEYVPDHWGDPHDQWLQLMELARRDSRIRIVTEIMSDSSYFGLINECDCIVTTHRAEGFGYLPAYGMLLGKAVISTDYSGTTDFCTAETGWPVRYRLKPVMTGEFIMDVPGAVWADVEREHLIETMREVVENAQMRQRRGRAAQILMRQRYSLDAQAARYKARL